MNGLKMKSVNVAKAKVMKNGMGNGQIESSEKWQAGCQSEFNTVYRNRINGRMYMPQNTACRLKKCTKIL